MNFVNALVQDTLGVRERWQLKAVRLQGRKYIQTVEKINLYDFFISKFHFPKTIQFY